MCLVLKQSTSEASKQKLDRLIVIITIDVSSLHLQNQLTLEIIKLILRNEKNIFIIYPHIHLQLSPPLNWSGSDLATISNHQHFL